MGIIEIKGKMFLIEKTETGFKVIRELSDTEKQQMIRDREWEEEMIEETERYFQKCMERD